LWDEKLVNQSMLLICKRFETKNKKLVNKSIILIFQQYDGPP